VRDDPSPGSLCNDRLAADGFRASGRQHLVQYRHADGSLGLLGSEAALPLPLCVAQCHLPSSLRVTQGVLGGLPRRSRELAKGLLARTALRDHSLIMFVVSEADAAAIRAAFDQEGELSAAIEVRRLFPGITDNAKAREHARTIAGWKPRPGPVTPVTQLRPRKQRL